MKVINTPRPGQAISFSDSPKACPGEEEVLVQISTIGVNRADILQCLGHYPPPKGASSVLGLEICGTIIDTGKHAHHWQKGQRCVALLAAGGYAEYVAVHKDHLLPLPDHVSDEEGATLIEACATSYHMLYTLGQIKPGQRVLIHAGSSGIGVIAIQIAALAGAEVMTTTRDLTKAERLKSLGATEVIRADQLTDSSIDLSLNMLAGETLSYDLKALKPQGRLVLMGALAGKTEKMNSLPIITKSLTVLGDTIRGKSVAEKAALIKNVSQVIWPWLEEKKLTAVVDRVFPWEETQQAFDYMVQQPHLGKIVLNTRSRN